MKVYSIYFEGKKIEEVIGDKIRFTSEFMYIYKEEKEIAHFDKRYSYICKDLEEERSKEFDTIQKEIQEKLEEIRKEANKSTALCAFDAFYGYFGEQVFTKLKSTFSKMLYNELLKEYDDFDPLYDYIGLKPCKYDFKGEQ